VQFKTALENRCTVFSGTRRMKIPEQGGNAQWMEVDRSNQRVENILE